MRKILFVLLTIFILCLTSCEMNYISEFGWNKAFSLDSFSNVTFVIVTGEDGKVGCEKITIKADDGKYSYLVEKIFDESKGF